MTEPNVSSCGGADNTSLTLLEKARARDDAAWVRLTELYSPLVDHWCFAKGLQHADAANVRQEVLTAALAGLASFERKPTPGSFRAWLKRITLNEIAEYRRRERPGQCGVGGSDALDHLAQLPGRDPDDTPEPAPEGEVKMLYRRALELIAKDFKESTWKAFVRVVIDGQRVKDVAEELGVSENIVSKAYPRVLARLRAEFGAHLHP